MILSNRLIKPKKEGKAPNKQKQNPQVKRQYERWKSDKLELAK
jgi:hypothetical protein